MPRLPRPANESHGGEAHHGEVTAGGEDDGGVGVGVGDDSLHLGEVLGEVVRVGGVDRDSCHACTGQTHRI